jgi:hypothetical protein
MKKTIRHTVMFWMAVAAIMCSAQTWAQTSVPQPGEPPFYEAPLTNGEIAKLTTAGLGTDAIVAKIKQATGENFDVSTDALIALRRQKVSTAVIAAMVDRVGKRVTAAPPLQAIMNVQSPDRPGTEPMPPSGPAEQTRGDASHSISEVADFFCQKALDDGHLKYDDDDPTTRYHSDYSISECKVENGTLRIVEITDRSYHLAEDPSASKRWRETDTTTVSLSTLEWPALRRLTEKRWLSLEIRCANGNKCQHLANTKSGEVCTEGERRHYVDCRTSPSSEEADLDRGSFGFADEEEFLKALKAISKLVQLSGGKKRPAELF